MVTWNLSERELTVEEERKERILNPPKIETRAYSLIPLIEEPMVEELIGARLPLALDVFFAFFSLHSTKKLVLPTAKRVAIKATYKSWELISITLKKIDNEIWMLTSLYDEYLVSMIMFYAR